MISFVRGKVADLTGDALVIDLGGIGLEVFAPFARLQPAPAIGEEILLYTHLQIREDNWQLALSTGQQQNTARLSYRNSGSGIFIEKQLFYSHLIWLGTIQQAV